MFILTFLVLTFALFTALKVKAGETVTKYPPRMNCNALSTLFAEGSAQDSPIDKAMFFAYAEKDKQLTLDKAGGGFYQCYCQLNSGTSDFIESLTDQVLSGEEVAEVTDEERLQKQSAELCYEYNIDTYWAFFWTNFVTFLVSAINYALTILNQTAIE
jgi:hypothetical protein